MLSRRHGSMSLKKLYSSVTTSSQTGVQYRTCTRFYLSSESKTAVAHVRAALINRFSSCCFKSMIPASYQRLPAPVDRPALSPSVSSGSLNTKKPPKYVVVSPRCWSRSTLGAFESAQLASGKQPTVPIRGSRKAFHSASFSSSSLANCPVAAYSVPAASFAQSRLQSSATYVSETKVRRQTCVSSQTF
ncbi:hypothetical protein GOODEAATRI_003428 [Goodea atripinnis]|uniref:Uncharacterized protein n=1 Tax=Goodea atripinnis TaxID=208336 RepID=A0ABV0MNZ4_9TELE